jgi:hypothetical protein
MSIQKVFYFTGHLADEGVLTEVHFPTVSAFFPSFSFLGVQVKI